jgi:arsenate reductase (thioredoxin)
MVVGYLWGIRTEVVAGQAFWLLTANVASISHRSFPEPWTDEVVRAADVVITMGCGDTCPVFPGKRYEERVLDDPHGMDIEHVRPVRDEIEQRVRALLQQLSVPARP